MLHLPTELNRIYREYIATSRKDYTATYKIDNKHIYDILDQICNDTKVYPNVKQYKSKQNGRGAFYATHKRWLGPNHINETASKAEAALQTLTCISKKNY